MPTAFSTPLLVAMLLLCLLSFAWAMKNFFTRPTGTSFGMLLIKYAGTALGLIHLLVLTLLGAADAEHAAIAAFVYVTSLALFWWTVNTNRRTPLSAAFSSDLPQRIVQEGPYRFVRHPFYASYLLMWFAAPIGIGEPWLYATAALMVVLYYVAAKTEEQKFAQSAVAQQYALYRSTTGLFFPNPLKMLNPGLSLRRMTVKD
jgi:protein-S-isoprenylcysteine O-methyltransferase Ste14